MPTPPGRSAVAARRALVAVAALTLLAAACGGSATQRVPTTLPAVTEAPPEPTTTSPQPAEDPTPSSSVAPVPGAGYAWVVGDCFDFGRDDGLEALPYAPYGDANLTPCDGPHTHDVYHVERVPEGDDAPFPSDLGDRVDAACSGAFLDAYGLMWPDSTYSLIRYLPDEDEWAAGERYLACMLYRATDGGLVERRSAAAGGADSDWPADTGSCFTGDLRSVRQPEAVACDTPHTFEVVAVGAHPALSGDAFPSQTQLDGFADQFCIDELTAFTGSSVGPVSVIPIRFGRSEWELGYRRIRCLAFTTQDSELALVRGSFAGEWDVVGTAGGDTVTA